VDEEDALKKGMEANSKEFVETVQRSIRKRDNRRDPIESAAQSASLHEARECLGLAGACGFLFQEHSVEVPLLKR